MHVLLELQEVTGEHERAGGDRDRGGEPGAGDAERPPGHPAADQHRREHGIDQHGRDLHDHRRLHHAGAAQPRHHHHVDVLQREPRQEPVQVGRAGRHGRGVGPDQLHVPAGRSVSRDERRGRADRAERHRLVEDEIRVGRVLAPDRLRDERHRADAERLREGHDDEHRDAGGADARKRGVAELRDEIEIDQQVQGLRQHAGGDRHRHRQQVAGDRALGQVAHVDLPVGFAGDQPPELGDRAGRGGDRPPVELPGPHRELALDARRDVAQLAPPGRRQHEQPRTTVLRVRFECEVAAGDQLVRDLLDVLARHCAAAGEIRHGHGTLLGDGPHQPPGPAARFGDGADALARRPQIEERRQQLVRERAEILRRRMSPAARPGAHLHASPPAPTVPYDNPVDKQAPPRAL